MLKKIKNKIERYLKDRRMRSATKTLQQNIKNKDRIYMFKK